MLKKTPNIIKKMLVKKELKSFVIPKIEENYYSKCYICNQNVTTSTGVELLKANLLSSNGSIPQKIAKIMGNDCMVLVSEDDCICSKCINLLNRLDHLEIEITKILDEITNYLNIKYNITSNNSIPIPAQNKRGTKRKYPDNDLFENQPEIEKQLSEMFGSPVTVTPANQLKTISAKLKNVKNTFLFKCPLCRQGFNDKTRLHFHITDSHLSKYRCHICQITFKDGDLLEKHVAKNNCTKTNNTTLLSLDNKKFKCAICSQKFETKELLNVHLKKHKTAYFKCGSCGETFQKRDLLMKHLELHTKNKSTVEENSINKKEIKFIDCKSCALTYIDNEHYSSHLNSSAHRKTKFDIKTEEKIDTSLNQIDLEQIFEKLHSDVTADENVGNGTDLTADNVIDLIPTDSVLDTTKDDKNHTNKVYLYKCPGCSDLYDNSNDLQLHILTVGHHHVDYNSEIQILEVDNTNNIIGQSIDMETKNKTTNNNEIKIISLDENNTNNIQFIASDDGSEIKFFIHNDHTDNVQLLSTSDNTVLSHNSNDNTYHEMQQQHNTTNKTHDIHELFQSVVDSTSTAVSSAATATTTTTMINSGVGIGGSGGTERSKIQIIDEKTIDISQFINIHKKSMMSKQNYHLNDLCTLSIKTEAQSNNQVISNMISSQLVSTLDPTNTDIKTIGVPSSALDQKESTPSLIYGPQRKIYKCCRCDFKCLTHDIIKAHMTKHNNNNHKIEQQQSENVTSIPSIVDSKNDFSSATTTTTTDTTVNENNENESPTSLLHECKQCKQNFKSINMLKRHKNTYHRVPICAYCNKQMKNLHILRIHEQSHMNRGDVCKCDDCGKQFKTKCGLNNHRPIHTGNYKLFCEFCNRGFMSKVVLEEHRSKHTKEERFICDICGKKFQFKSTYWIHRKWHDNPYPYKCNYCNRKFRHTSLLAVHKRKHTGERPYECPHCKQTFAVSGTLKCHLILHTGVYPFTCEICQRGFTTRHKYAVHLSKIHGDSNLLNQNQDKQNNFKMVIKEIDHNIDDITTSSSKNHQDITNTHLESVIDNHMLINEETSTGVGQVSSKCNGTETTSILNNWYEDNSSIIASLVDS